MSWDELDNDVQTSNYSVARTSVILKTKNRRLRDKILHYFITILIGRDIVRKLGWTKETRLKFQWGTDENLGMVRIACILNDATGWKPCIFKSGHAMIQNKALPNHVNMIERHGEISYSIEKDIRKDDLFLLKLKLPIDFYLNNKQGINCTEDSFLNAASLKISSIKSKEPYQMGSFSALTKSEIDTLNRIDSVTKDVSQQTHKISSSKNNTHSKTDSKYSAPMLEYDQAVKKGGPITIENLCRFIRIYIGDSLTKIGMTTYTLNETIFNDSEILNYANQYRIKKNQPIFSLLE